MHINLTQRAHERVASILQVGDFAMDATCGNGHDTVFLAQTVGATGHVLAIDIQRSALQKTEARLLEHGLSERVQCLQACHSQLANFAQHHPQPRVVMFNLGYLPHADKSITTQAETTTIALKAAWDKLSKGGLLSVILYPAHPGGAQEAQAALDTLHALPEVAIEHIIPEAKQAPQAVFCQSAKS